MSYMGFLMRKSVFGVSDKVMFKPVFSATETSSNYSNQPPSVAPRSGATRGSAGQHEGWLLYD